MKEKEPWRPLVSIITVTYNSGKFLENTINSVLEQSYRNIEYIIVDGGSTDSTISIIRSYSSKISKWSSEPDLGIYDAMNKGIMRSSGEIIGIINSDDWYETNAVELAVQAFHDFPDTCVVHGNMKMYSENTCPLYVLQPSLNNKNLWYSMTLNHPTCFLRKRIYQTFGYFDINYQLRADHELFLRLWTHGARFAYVAKLFANMRVGGASWKQLNQANKEYLFMLKNYGCSRVFIFAMNLYISIRTALRKSLVLMGFSSLVQKIGFCINRRYVP